MGQKDAGLRLATLVTSSSPDSHIWWLLLKIMMRRAQTAKMTEVWRVHWPLVLWLLARIHEGMRNGMYGEGDAVLHAHFAHELGYMGLNGTLFDG